MKEEFLASPAVAITFANRAFPSVSWIAPVGVCLSTLGSLNGICYGYSRIPFVGARNGFSGHLKFGHKEAVR